MVNHKHKLSLLTLLFTTLLTCSLADNITIYVDENAHIGGDGNKSTPYSTLSDAFNQIISNFTLTYGYAEIVITNTSSNLQFPALTILGPNTSSLTIGNGLTPSQGVIIQRQDCLNLPTVQFSSRNAFNASNLASLNFLGLNIQPVQPSDNPFFKIQNLTSIGLASVCLMEDESMGALSTIFSAFTIQSITVSSLFVSKLYPSIFLESDSRSISLQDIQVLQNLLNSSTSFNLPFFSFNTSYPSANVSLNTISIFTNARDEGVYALQIMSAIYYNSVSVTNLLMVNTSVNVTTNIFSFQTIHTVSITDINVANTSVASNSMSLFYMYNVTALQIDTVTINQVISLADIATIDDTGVETVNLYLFRAEEFNTTLNVSFLNNVLIQNSSLLYITVIKIKGQFNNFNLSNVTITNSTFRYKIFNYWKAYLYDNMTYNYLQPTYWTADNFNFNNCSFYDGKFLAYNYYQDDEIEMVLAIGEPDIIQMSNITITNSVFTRDNEGTVTYYSYFFSSTGYRLEVDNLQFTNNIMNDYVLYYQSTRLASLLITDSLVENISLTNSVIFMMNYIGLQIPLISSGYYNDEHYVIYPQYIVMLLADSTIKNISLVNAGMSLVMSIAAPFFFMDSNTIQNLITNGGRLYEAGFFTPIPTDDIYEQYVRNQTFEQLLFGQYPKLLALLDSSIYDADSSGTSIVYQYRFTNNLFADNCIQGDYTFTKLQAFDYQSSGILYDSNNFTNNNLGPELDSHFLWFIFDSHLEVKNNIFINTTNQGYLVICETMYDPAFVNISNNIILQQQLAGFVIHRPEDLDTLIISNNFLNNSVLYLAFIELIPIRGENCIIIYNNSFLNTQVYSSNLTAYRINFIYLEVPMPSLDFFVDFSSNTLSSITLTKKDPYIKGSFDNSLITLVLGNSSLTIWNCIFQNTNISADGSYLSVTAGTLNISQSNFSNITTSGKYGSIYALSPNITVNTTVFTNNTGLAQVNGGVIYVDFDPTYTVDAISLVFTNSQFLLNSAYQGGVLFMENTPLNLTIENNLFFDNYASNTSAQIHFINVNFLSLNLLNNIIKASAVTEPITANFLRFEQVQGSGEFNMTQTFISEEVSMNLINLTSSSQFFLNVDNINVMQDTPISYTSSRRLLASSSIVPHFSLIKSDSGMLQLRNVNISNMFLSTDSIFALGCSNQSNSVSVSNSVFNNITQSEDTNAIYSAVVNTFDDLQIATGGGIFFTDPLASLNTCNISINIQNSQFISITHPGSGGVINSLAIGPTIINITGSDFTNIQAGQGAGVSTYSPTNSSVITVLNSTFVANTVSGYGGAIFNIGAKLIVNNSEFLYNVANYSGGAIYSYYFGNAKPILNESNNTFINNTYVVMGGNDLAARPKKLYVTFSQEDYANSGMQGSYVNVSNDSLASQPVLLLTNVTTYTLQLVSFLVTLFDELEQPINDISDNPTPTIYFYVNLATKSSSFTSSNCSTSNGSTLCVVNDKNVMIYGNAESPTGNISINYLSGDISLTTMILVQTRNCIPGEVFDSTDLTCTLCPAGKYSLDPIGDSSCKPCPNGVDCPGGYYLDLRPSFWRMNTSTDLIQSCGGTAARCKGTYYSVCNEGFIGTLCGRCDLTNGYVRQGSPADINCGKCPADWLSIVLNLLYLLGIFGYNIYFIKSLVYSNRAYYKAIKEGLPTPQSTGPYIRGITTYVQIISIVSSFNAGFYQFLGLESITTDHPSNVFFNQDCFFVALGFAPEHQLKAEIILFLLVPFIKLFIVVSYDLIKWRFHLTVKRNIRLVVCWFSIFILEQPGVVQALIAYTSCSQISSVDPQLYVYDNEFFLCDTPEYNSFYYFVVMPFLNLYFWVLPSIFLGILFYKRRNLNSEKLRLALGGLFNEYTPEAYYWGVAVLFFKVLLLVINQASSSDIKIKALILLLVFYCYKELLNWKQPYYDPNLMKAEHLSIYAYMTTVFCSYMFIGEDSWIKILCLIAMIVANGLAIGFIAKQMYIDSREAIMKGLDMLKKRMTVELQSYDPNPAAKNANGSQDMTSPDKMLDSSRSINIGEFEDIELSAVNVDDGNGHEVKGGERESSKEGEPSKEGDPYSA